MKKWIIMISLGLTIGIFFTASTTKTYSMVKIFGSTLATLFVGELLYFCLFTKKEGDKASNIINKYLRHPIAKHKYSSSIEVLSCLSFLNEKITIQDGIKALTEMHKDLEKAFNKALSIFAYNEETTKHIEHALETIQENRIILTKQLLIEQNQAS